jgi:hypothetical protein
MTTIFIEGGAAATDSMIAELSQIISANKSNPNIAHGITIKKVQYSNPHINSVLIGSQYYRINDWVQLILNGTPPRPIPQQQAYQAPVHGQTHNQVQQVPTHNSHPGHYPQKSHMQAPTSYVRGQSAQKRPTTSNSINRFDLSDESPPRSAPPPPKGSTATTQTLKSAFANQLQGTRGDEEGFSARDANIIATMMCEQTTLMPGQM